MDSITQPGVSLSKEPLWSRRRFLAGSLATAALAPALSLTAAEPAPGLSVNNDKPRKIKLGVVGNGGRGAWIARLFKNHGGFEMYAVADYFQEVADQCGNDLGVDPARRFSTLSGYKRLFECGVEAVALEVPPYFFPEQAAAAVDAGLHVYMAKPVAVDVPGALQILAAAQKATAKKRCFLVDYQMPTDPVLIEIKKRIATEGFGAIAQIATVGKCSVFNDPAFTENLESRLRSLTWVNDRAMGCDYLGNYDIHAIDVALWVLGERPTAASGSSRICRSTPHGDSRDVCSVIYDYASGVVHNHFGEAQNNKVTGELSCRVHGTRGNATLNYWGKSNFVSFDDVYDGEAANLYDAGAIRNIARFHEDVTRERFENTTVPRAVDGALACILGIEAGLRKTRLTLDDLIRENRKLEVNLRGLKS
jgi:predicted dehydrogenase